MLTKDGNILLKSLVIEGAAKGPQFVLPEWAGFKNHLWIFKNDEVGIHYLYSELEEFSKAVRDKALLDTTFAEQYRTVSKNMIDNGVAKTRELARKVHSGISSTELNYLFVGFCDNFKLLTDTIVMTLEELDAEAGSDLKDPQDLITLATPPELSVEAEEELKRLLLIEEINNKLPGIWVKTDRKSVV